MDAPLPTLPDPSSESDLPDRHCTWCRVTMHKRFVADGRFIHYTCPQCIFQQTRKREAVTGPPS